MSNNTQKLTLADDGFSPITTEENSVIVKLLPIIGVVFIAYLIICAKTFCRRTAVDFLRDAKGFPRILEIFTFRLQKNIAFSL
jgi:hypothetical protein